MSCLTSPVVPGKAANGPGRESVKSKWSHSDQERRRRLLLDRQRDARRDLANHARQLAFSDPRVAKRQAAHQYVEDDEDQPTDTDNVSQMDDMSNYEPRKVRARHETREDRIIGRRTYWSTQLSTPEWMIDVPVDLNGKASEQGEGWYVMPRPEGKHVLVVSSGGRTTARQLSGAMLFTFQSSLPGGSQETDSGDGYCILDCIYHELDETLYVLDMMAWKGYSLYDCTADFRFYWVRTKLAEVECGSAGPGNRFRVLPLPYRDCDAEGVRLAHSQPVPFIRDGLLFYSKQGHYSLGCTPLVLLWKDEHTTRYLMQGDTQAVVLSVAEGHAPHDLRTCDGVVLGQMDAATAHQNQVKAGDLVRFGLLGADEDIGEDGAAVPLVAGLSFEKRCSPVRPMADSWSKILFQARLRTGHRRILMDDIVQVAAVPWRPE